MAQTKELRFEVSANLQKLIGEELISNDEMAFIELVKNAYDSGASLVVISVYQESLTTGAYITVRDNGDGMSFDNFKKRFMFAGYSEREAEAAAATRVPTGEKGIGRFAADKIGAELIVTTKTANSSEALQVRVDWTAFRNQARKFNEIVAPYAYVDPPQDLGATGTLLTINKLRSRWDREKLDALRTSLQTLLNPFLPNKTFDIQLERIGQRPSSESVVPERPTNYDYELQFKVAQDGTVLRRFRTPSKPSFKDWVPVPGLSAHKLVGLNGRLLYYIKKPPKAWVKGLSSGVQLYRDGFLMQPFGSPISDRLKLIETRAKRAGHAPVVPNRLFGFVDISRLTHPTLKDTTSRQTMLETDELNEAVRVLKAQTDFLGQNLLEEVKKPSWRRSTSAQAILLEQARLNSLGNLSVGIGHEIRQPLQSILSHVDAIELRLAELSVNDGQVTTSLQKINDASDRIDQTITFIKKLSSGDLHDIGVFDLADIVRKEIKLLEAQNEDIQFLADLPNTQPATTNQTTAIHVLANLLRNSVEAIREVQDERSGTISVRLIREGNSHICEVGDNGVGIDDKTKPKIFKKFNTQKTGGLGIGLTYCHTILEAQGGRISFASIVGVGTTFRFELPEKAE